MATSPYVKNLREKIGHGLLLLPGVAAFVRDAGGRVLLMRRADGGGWGLPAGAVDPGETPARAAAREVWEETGLRVVPVRVVGVFGGDRHGYRGTYPNGDRVEFMVAVFECRTAGGELKARDGESAELRYFAPDEVPPLRTEYPRELFALRAAAAEPALFEWDDAWLDEICR